MVQDKMILICLFVVGCAFTNVQSANIAPLPANSDNNTTAAPVIQTAPLAPIKDETKPMIPEENPVVVPSSPVNETPKTVPEVAPSEVAAVKNADSAPVQTDVTPTAAVEKSTTHSSTTTSSTSTTTTTAPETSTSSTSTTTPSTTTTTTTTTKGPMTTTPAPGPIPAPSVGQWNSSCIIIRMAAQLNFTYITVDNKTVTTLHNIPPNAVVNDVECTAPTFQTIDLNWGTNASVNMMLLQFDIRNKSFVLSKIQITLNLDNDHFPNAKANETVQLLHVGAELKTPLEMSYHCTRSQKFNLTETVDSGKMMGTILLSDVQMEAFRKNNKSTTFSTVHDCDASGTSDVVPIAVGLALVALILIVLIAYLCARRRSTLRGYMSF